MSLVAHASLWLDGNPSFAFGLDTGEVTVEVRVEVVPASLTTDSFRLLEHLAEGDLGLKLQLSCAFQSMAQSDDLQHYGRHPIGTMR